MTSGAGRADRASQALRRVAGRFGSDLLCRWRPVRYQEHGAMLVEMAMVLPAFFMLLFGIFNFSLVLFGRGNAICAANEAARYAALHSSTAVVPSTTTSVKSYAAGFLFAAPASTTVITPVYSNGNTIGGTVTVTVTVTYSTGIPFYGIRNLTISSTAQRTISR